MRRWKTVGERATPALVSQTVYGAGLSLRFRRATVEARYAYDQRWEAGRRTAFVILAGSTVLEVGRMENAVEGWRGRSTWEATEDVDPPSCEGMADRVARRTAFAVLAGSTF